MTRELILAKLSDLKQQIRKKKVDIEDYVRVLPQARKEDARERREWKKYRTPPEHVCVDRERRHEESIARLRGELDVLYNKQNELNTELRNLPDPSRLTGTIKWFNENKGFGFITISGQDDVFVHQTGFVERGMPEEGMAVSFKRVKGKKGFQAVDVRFVSE
jgi:CspA family cold shock protein